MPDRVVIKDLYVRAFDERVARQSAGLVPVLEHRLKNDTLGIAAVDPETIGLVLEGLDLLFGIFGPDETEVIEEELVRIGEWMEQIEAQLEYMNRLLEDIRELLIELQVRITEGFRRDAEAEVRAVIKVYAALIPALREEAASESVIKKMDPLHTELVTRTRKLMEYGYASLATVFYGFRAELDLGRILGLGRSAERAVARQYAGYFEAALDHTRPGSIAHEIAAREQAVEGLRATFTPGDKGFVGPAWWYRDNRTRECSEGERGHFCRWVWDKYRLHPGYRVTGSLEEGFDAVAADIGLLFSDTSRGDNEYLEGKDAAIADATVYARRTHLPPYIDAASRFPVIRREVESLDHMRKMCERFAAIARKVTE